jgi:hypothetical protein
LAGGLHFVPAEADAAACTKQGREQKEVASSVHRVRPTRLVPRRSGSRSCARRLSTGSRSEEGRSLLLLPYSEMCPHPRLRKDGMGRQRQRQSPPVAAETRDLRVAGTALASPWYSTASAACGWSRGIGARVEQRAVCHVTTRTTPLYDPRTAARLPDSHARKRRE